jgi:hypothetical protein
VSAPEITAEAFIAWARANPDKLPSGVADALGPERDWADACPFCGEHKLPVIMPETPHGEVVCAGCGARGPMRDAAGQRADPLERWNSRCRPIGNDTVTDEVLDEALDDAERSCKYGLHTFAEACRKHFAGLTFPLQP